MTSPALAERRTEALSRATQGTALTNYSAIYAGFMEKGIAESEIHPRVNIFTFQAWKALGRSVRKGEHGVKVITWIEGSGKVDPATGEVSSGTRFPRTVTVFHISQTTDEVR